MELKNNISELKREYDPDNKYNLEFAMNKYGIDIVFAYDKQDVVRELPKDNENVVIITNGSVPQQFLKELNHFKKAQIHDVKRAHIKEVELIIENLRKPKKVVGFGGGVAIDVAKKVAKLYNIGSLNKHRINNSLTVFSTAGSNDGIISPNASLYYNGIRQTISANAPSKLIIPLYIWDKNWEMNFSFSKAGVCDVLSNISSLQEWSFSISRGKEQWKEEYNEFLSYALNSLIYLIDHKINSRIRGSALVSSSFSMYHPVLSSRPASGGDHEIERVLSDVFSKNNKVLPHGQGAAIGALIMTKIYEKESPKLPEDLFFNSKTLHKDYIEVLKLLNLFEYVTDPLKEINKDDLISALERAPNIRPRYGLLKEIKYTKKDWNKIIKEIIS